MRVCGRNALCTSGRQIVIFAMPSSVVSYRMSSYLPDSCQAMLSAGLVGSVMFPILHAGSRRQVLARQDTDGPQL